MSDETIKHPMQKGAIYGLDALDLPKNWTPLEAVVMIKGLDEDGDVSVCHRFTLGLSSCEALGMIIPVADMLRSSLAAGFMPAERDEEGEDER